MAEEEIDKDVVAPVERFLDALARGNDNAAWTDLLSGSPIAADPRSIADQKKLAGAQLAKLGAILGHELLEARPVGSSLVVLKYLVRHELEATTWAFAYYKPKEKWILTGLRWHPSVAYLAP
jgi:hypothetical protein